ncbi:hypothetical protein GQ43DRAFT_444168 [Delitschia confertaspora ATCC 74209]|uniref:Uncharacterized protein n=1 Tax=Delitschia confertaspora ATCC 74209 TaxID=1513339 RepID=A0A9P4MNV0_9PLEO|nr:hypothetical protein GQ43DRAFT_444168 [Delitschia confertaspora ATCC 74209]
MDHANALLSVRFGWTAGPANSTENQPNSNGNEALPSTPPLFPASSDFLKNKRFAACQNTLYHQLECGHRIRTDLVEDCGANCIEATNHTPFFCETCLETEYRRIWIQIQSQHNAQYPPLETMVKGQYDQWYAEFRQLELQYETDRASHVISMKRQTRPSNRCMDAEPSMEELAIAQEIEALSLAMGLQSAHEPETTTSHLVNHTSLPSDSAEQLHWALGQLDLGRGSCGAEIPQTNGTQASPVIDENTQWVFRG